MSEPRADRVQIELLRRRVEINYGEDLALRIDRFLRKRARKEADLD